ncbi:MAG: hypothetical protein GAK45_02136 [Pseudomonas citronellolis]|nr:MAG: hypothetical protein GAK45_02136 [Pseudomonas citronellolis]
MSRRAGLAWWAAALPLLPLVLPLAVRTRRTALRLAPAAGARQGLAGQPSSTEPLRLLLLGESTVAGVGASCLQFALAGRLASALAAQLQRPVAWSALGENGITLGEACERLLPQVDRADYDLVVLVFGVNDSTGLTSAKRWRTGWQRLIGHFQQHGAQVVCTAVPPLRHFSALPWLLRQLLGRRAEWLDTQLRTVAEAQGAGYSAVSLAMRPDYLAMDGYHPSALGYQVWAEQLAHWLVDTQRASVS